MTDKYKIIPDCSIVIPVYFNEGSLETTFQSLQDEVIARNPKLRFEVVFVDDGSGDGSLIELLSLKKSNPETIKIIKLTRNFGQPRARLAGLKHANGKCIVSISADGQDPASLIHDMLRFHFQEKYEVVICERAGRDESWYRQATSRMFYGLMRKLCFPNMPEGGFDFVLLGRQALDIVLSNQEANPFIQGQILWTGFRSHSIPYRRRERKVGRSRWTFGMKFKLLMDGVLNYSFFPIRMISACGVGVAVMGVLFAVALVLRKLIWGTQVDGWVGLSTIVLVTSGMQMLMLGVIGEYLWRVLAEVQNRAPFVIERIYDGTTDET